MWRAGCFVTGQCGAGQRVEPGGSGGGKTRRHGGTTSGHGDLNLGSQSQSTWGAAQPLPPNYPLSLETPGVRVGFSQ